MKYTYELTQNANELGNVKQWLFIWIKTLLKFNISHPNTKRTGCYFQLVYYIPSLSFAILHVSQILT